MPKRNDDNSTLTISLPKILKERIEKASAADRRKVSPWCVIQLEKILDRLEANPYASEPMEFSKAAEGETPEHLKNSPQNAVKYPGKKGLRALPPGKKDAKAK